MIESVSLCQAIGDEALPTRVCQSVASRVSKRSARPGGRACKHRRRHAAFGPLRLALRLFDPGVSVCVLPPGGAAGRVFALYLVHTGPWPARTGSGLAAGCWKSCRESRLRGCFRRPACQPVPCEPDRLLDSRHGGAYRLALCGALSEKVLQRAIGATVLLGAVFTIYFMTRADTEAGKNASAYLLAWCLPLLLAAEKSRGRSALVALAAAAILLTVKRGAMLALGFSSIAYALAYLRLYGSPRALARVVGFLLVLGAVSLGVLASNWDAVKTRFEDTSGSGRDNMYAMLVEHWRKAEPQNLVFGFGINSVQRYTGMMYGSEDDRGPYAHSDWFQLMHDFGLVGIVLLGWLHAAFLVLIRRGFKMRNPVTPSLAMGYTILFLVNIYSGQLMSLTAIYCGLLLVCGALAISTARQTAPRGAENGQAETKLPNRLMRSPSVREFRAAQLFRSGQALTYAGKGGGRKTHFASIRRSGEEWPLSVCAGNFQGVLAHALAVHRRVPGTGRFLQASGYFRSRLVGHRGQLGMRRVSGAPVGPEQHLEADV